MYEPPHFVEERLEILHGLIRSHPLGLLASNGEDGPVADVVPFMLHPEGGKRGVLRAHLARSNGHWQRIANNPDASVLVVFQGPQAYVTPSWYATKQETGKVVPTWNYAIVQVRGRAIVRPDPEWLRTQVGALTDLHEAGRSHPWAVGDAPERYIDMQLRAIVGLEIEICDIRGKWKVSQNRPVADREGVAHGLASSESPADIQMSGLVKTYGLPEG